MPTFIASWTSDEVLSASELENRLRGKENEMPTHYGIEGFMNTIVDNSGISVSLTPCNVTLTPGIVNRQLPEVDSIIFHEPATIVFWADGTKTVVKCMEGQEYSKYYGFVCALAKKVYGTNSAVERIVKNKSD